MLPPDLAAFGFTLDAAGADAALAARVRDACGRAGARDVAVVGARRWGLLAEIARDGPSVVAFDPSRAVLAQTKRGLEERGVARRVTLFATDPRDAEIPGGVDAALVTSAMWRVLLHAESQRQTLASLSRALRGPALLLLDLDRVPRAGARSRILRRGPGRQVWRIRRAGGVVRVTCESPGVAPVPLDLSPIGPEETVEVVREAGFAPLSATDAGTGAPLGPGSPRMWLVARRDHP